MLIKDLFLQPPSKKDEFWKYTDFSFLDLEISDKASYSVKTSLNRKAIDAYTDLKYSSFFEISSTNKEEYIIHNNDYLEISLLKGIIRKEFVFTVPENEIANFNLCIQSFEDIEVFLAILKMTFFVNGILNLNIISSVKNNYLLKEINFIINNKGEVNIDYISHGLSNNKVALISEQADDSRFDLKYRSLLANNENTDLTVYSNIVGKNCFLNHDIKCVLTDSSTFSCLGEINIFENADNTEANHYSSTLALSENIRINSRPVLRINNKNVKCSHGSPSSYIKNEDRFYMNARGLSKNEADKIYVTSFLNHTSSLIIDLINKGVN